ncbi:hypothetical protein HHI36_003967 [Cryptolaemus montrouzieri]|uniref:Uncharacterized protein n=1 Tax=Cryptolaemus montrouzieri TaxID=559131 RepID=A0ABD2NPR4_9CUCU
MRNCSIGIPNFHRMSGRQIDSLLGEDGVFSKKVRSVPSKIIMDEDKTVETAGERNISDDADVDRSFSTRMEEEQGTQMETNLEQSKYEGDMYSKNLQEIFRVYNDHEDSQTRGYEGDTGLLGLSRESIDQLSLSGEEEESTHSIVSEEMQRSLVDVVEPCSGYDLYADKNENDVQRPTIGTNYTVSYGSAEETLDLINFVQMHHGGDENL